MIAACLAGVAGAWVSHAIRQPDEPDLTNVVAMSHFVTHHHDGDAAIDTMGLTLFTFRANEDLKPGCPPQLKVVPTERSIFDAVGPLPFENATTPLTKAAARAITEQWKHLSRSGAPVRVLVKHYPRPRLAGRCVTVHATFYDVPDPYFDARPEGRVDGAILEIRKTYQLEGDAPVLIEAALEAHIGVDARHPRLPATALLGNDELADFRRDALGTAHFELYGGGERLGLYWCDRAMGRGDARAWSRAYRIHLGGAERVPSVDSEPVTGAIVRALREAAAKL